MALASKFEELEIWQLARKQANDIFLLYKEGLFSKDYSLKNQINASSGSVMDNIAEGFERSGNKEFINFLLIAKASNGEVRAQLHRGSDRNYISSETYTILLSNNKTISVKITSLIKHLKNSEKLGFRYQ
jgi:four helix bundle protein